MLACGLLAGCVLGEGMVRWSGAAAAHKSLDLGTSETSYQRSENAVLGFELKPNYECENPDYIATFERTNAQGLRDGPRDIPKPAGTRRILLLGDSVVEGYGLPEAATISSQMEACYAGKEPPTEVLNFGVSAYCTKAEVELLATKGLQFAPDTVVVVFVENDFDNFNREAFPLGSAISRPALVEWGFKRLHLFRLLCVQFNLWNFRQSVDPASWNQEAIGDNNVSQGLLRLRELADRHDFEPILAVWPRFDDSGVRDMHYLPDSETLVVEAIAAQAGIPSFRLSPYFRRVAKLKNNRSPRTLFSQGDRLHPSAFGAQIAAEAIAEAIEQGVPAISNLAGPTSEHLEETISQLSARRPDYSRVYNRVGTEHLKRRDWEPAIRQFRLALEENEADAAAHCNLGIALLSKSPPSPKEARKHFEAAIAIDPYSATAHLNLGKAVEAADAEQAREHFIRAVQCQPEFVPAHVCLCRNLYRAGQYKAAAAGIEQVLGFEKKNVPAWRLLATIRTKQEDYAAAKTAFEELLKLAPEDAEAHNNLAAVYLGLGQRNAAIQHLRRAVEISPDHPRAATNLKKLETTSSPTP